MLDAIRYLVDNGIKWRGMPVDFPPRDRGYAFFRRWRDHGLVTEFHDRLRGQVRKRPGRDAAPTAGVIDSQSIKTSTNVPAADLGRRARRRPAHDGVPASSMPRACSEAV